MTMILVSLPDAGNHLAIAATRHYLSGCFQLNRYKQ